VATLTVHRATQQIGGNCIEVAARDGQRLILDVGRPLDAPRDVKDLLPGTLDRHGPVAGVLISHPHQDHWGLLEETPGHWPVYSGRCAADLMRLTANMFGTFPERDHRHWEDGKGLEIGPFRVMPLLTDHSAFDAYMLLIEVDGKKLLYSGDFRLHGRKASLVRRLMAQPPPALDVLLMEGTNLGSDKPTKSEADLEADFVALFDRTAGRVFVSWSAQNLDRTVTLYRACLRSGRTLVVDLYTAEVLQRLADAGRLPQPGWDGLKIVITRAFSRLYKIKGRGEFVDHMAQYGLSAAALARDPRRWVVMIRPSLIEDLRAKGVEPGPQDAWSFSQWRGYLRAPDGQRLSRWFGDGGATEDHIHTSGHASVTDLQAFAQAMKPRMLVPIHGVAWDTHARDFVNVHRLRDGEPMALD